MIIKHLKYFNQILFLSFVTYLDQCDEAAAIAYATKLIKDDKVDVIVGPACPAGNFN